MPLIANAGGSPVGSGTTPEFTFNLVDGNDNPISQRRAANAYSDDCGHVDKRRDQYS